MIKYILLTMIFIFIYLFANKKEYFTNNNLQKKNKNNLVCRIRQQHNKYIYKREKLENKEDIVVLVEDYKFFIDNHLNAVNYPINITIIDHPFKSKCYSVHNYKNFLENPNIKKVFSENWNNKPHPKLIQIPIGFESKAVINGNEEIMINISKNQKSLDNKPLKILCNTHFLIHKKPRSGSYNQRQEVIDKLENNSLVDFWKKKKTKEETWKEHDNYSFELCPEGNGLDTHRFYEALLLNTIPIVKKNSLEPLYSKFPCVIVNDWNEITEENCIKWKSELKDRIEKEKYKLNLNYWK